MKAPTSKSSMISFVIPVKNDPRIQECTNHLQHYIRDRVLNAEIIISGSGHISGASVHSSKYVPAMPASKGNAVRAGVLASAGEVICVCDADMRVPFEDLDAMFDTLEHADIVLGNRFDPSSRCDSTPPITRRVTSLVYRWIVRCIFGIVDTDTQFGLKVFRRSAARYVFRYQRIQGFSYDVELVLRAQNGGFRLANSPVRWRWHAQSTIRLYRVIPLMLFEIASLRVWHTTRGCVPLSYRTLQSEKASV